MLIYVALFSLILIGLSFWLVQKWKDKYQTANHVSFHILNGMSVLFILIVMAVYFLVNDLTAIPPVVYWAPIIAGVIIGISATVKNYIPGQLTSIALLVFMGVVAMFSIGEFLFLLAGAQVIYIFIGLRKGKQETNG